MAAEDLTAPPVLKLQSEPNFSGKLPSATPSSAEPPRNMGQSAALATAPESESKANADRSRAKAAAWARQRFGVRQSSLHLTRIFDGTRTRSNAHFPLTPTLS